MLLFDAHCHLDKQFFQQDIDSVIQRAVTAGVRLIVSDGLSQKTNEEVLALSGQFDVVRPALGLYPVEAAKMTRKEIDDAISFIGSHAKDIVSIGEVGLDYKEETDKGLQQYAFRKVIQLAVKTGRSLTVHSRKAEQDCIDILKEEKAKKVIMHCFSGKKRQVQEILDNGWFLSIPTNVVFSTHFQEMVKMAPLSRLLTETDSPFLGPLKGEKNEPANVVHSIKKIAEIKDLEPEEVANILWKNAQELFLSV
ncbi:MAG: TatD family hydrolase [DPANN group archaeon]|nr:TatD family hydrolase [DPANN group archaeon]